MLFIKNLKLINFSSVLFFLAISIFQEIDTSIIRPKIIGGVDAAKGEFPWLVSIKMTDAAAARLGRNNRRQDLCVGTIISSTKIATASHCVKYFHPNDLLVVAGAWNLTAIEPTQQIVPVYSKWIHPEFDDDTSRNDIAILEVKQLGENEFVSPIRLPPIGHKAAEMCWIAGWGQTLTETKTDILKKALVPIVSDDKCFETYQDFLDPTTQFCAGGEQVDACLYDTGGPLMCQDLGYLYFAGIVSWAEGCALLNYPGVYTRVSHYVELLQP